MARKTNEANEKDKVRKNVQKTAKKSIDTQKKSVAKTSVSNKRKSPSKSSQKNTTKRTANVKNVKPENKVLEYYDLPYRYNQTVVKILAQTPNTLFVYWDISDEDKNKYTVEYGKDFFKDTTPVLIIHNTTNNYSFEIEINDFANSWYFNVDDANCSYEVELGRKSKSHDIKIENNYLQVASSNIVEAPNNHVLFEREQNNVFFRNVKDNTTYSKNIVNLNFMQRIGKIYNIYDVYKKIYKNEELEYLKNNPSSYSEQRRN